MENQTNKLVEGNIGKGLFYFALPFLLSNFLQALYGAVDLFVVGQFADSPSVSAVAIGSQVMQTITGVISGIAMGGTVLLGRMTGGRDDKGAAKSVGTITVLLCILAAGLTVLMCFHAGNIVLWMETPKEAANYARQYILICSVGIPFIIGYNAVSSIFRGTGDSKTPVKFVALACVINIGADFLLTGWLQMGAVGAAVATISSQAVSFLVSLCYIRKKGLGFTIKKEDFRLDRAFAANILKVGLPLALQDALVNVSFLVITAIVNAMGVVASASVGVVEKIIVFAMLPPSAFAAAVAAMTAQNLGAKKPDRAYRTLWCGIGYSLVFGVLICIYCQLFPMSLTSIFSSDTRVIAKAAQYLKSYSIDCMLVSFIFCMNSYFSGMGKSMVSFLHSMAATFGVRIPLTYIFSSMAGSSLYRIGLAAPFASLVSLVICLIYLKVQQTGGRKMIVTKL